MDTIYHTYTRFLDAAKKFPRWNNTRRRPAESTGGKLLRSIIEEIGTVEDAIIEYKKDFFIVNYIGRENEIVDYIYSCFVGNIEDLENIKLLEPKKEITFVIKNFYDKLGDFAYYQDGYLVFSEKADSVTYSYNGNIYKHKLIKSAIWNVFDEFAFWVGLERFEDETNAQLMNRTVNTFRYRPSSTEEGLRNVIYNTLSNYGSIDMDDIVFETPDETNLSIIEDGESLYEKIAKFNRDIARTKQWDIDLWDNSFRELGYLPHVWDAPVCHYKDGVGYTDSLKTALVKDIDEDQTTDVVIKGYKKSRIKAEQYIRNNNISKELELTLKRYTDEMNPVPVQYRINASTLIPVNYPKNLFIETYEASNRRRKYHLQDLAIKTDNIRTVENSRLKADSRYTLELYPENNTFLCSKCSVESNGLEKSILRPQGDFYLDNGKLKNTLQLFYADQLSDFFSSTGMVDSENGFKLADNSHGNFSINTLAYGNAPLRMDYTCESYNIDLNPEYITQTGFKYKDEMYVSESGMTEECRLEIAFSGNFLSFVLLRNAGSMKSASANILVYIDGKYDASASRKSVRMDSSDYEYILELEDYSSVRVIIEKTSSSPIKVRDIRVKRYKITENRYGNLLMVEIDNYGKTDFELRSVVLGEELNNANSVYTLDIDTAGMKNPVLRLEHNGPVKLYDSTGEIAYYTVFCNDTDSGQAVYLDLSCFEEEPRSERIIRYSVDGLPYITIAPGEAVSEIELYGKYKKLISKLSLYDIIKPAKDEKIFVSRLLEGVIVKAPGGAEKLLPLNYKDIAKGGADTVKIYSTREHNLKSSFVSLDTEHITGEYGYLFDYVYLYDENSVDYIAWNSQNLTRNKTEDIGIEYNFLPSLSRTAQVAYKIANPENPGYDIRFEDSKKWTTVPERKITISAGELFSNSESIKTEIKTVRNSFTISNNISLDEVKASDGSDIDLGMYIISVPEHMKLETEPVRYTQLSYPDGTDLFVESDGFNKLAYSNIASIDRVEIDGKPVAADKYSLMAEEGIIAWTDESLYGEKFIVTYTYEKPKYLSYTDLDFLYDIAGYDIEALLDVTGKEYIVKNISAGNSFPVDYGYFSEYPDKISAVCCNPCFSASISNGFVAVRKIGEDDSVAVRSGYYYIDGKEHWYFADKTETDKERLNGLILYNTGKSGDNIILRKEAINLLSNSKMLCNQLAVHAMFDFNYYRTIPNISPLGHIGACESLSSWNCCKMSAQLSENNGGSIVFTADDSDGYALLDITHAIMQNRFISCRYSGTLEFRLGREVLIKGQPLAKSLYVEDIGKFTAETGYAYYDGSLLSPEEYRYYIIVKRSGNLDEILITDDNLESYKNSHKKAIEKFGLSIEETSAPGDRLCLDYSPVGAMYDGLESDKSLKLQTGTTADWGITRLKSYNLVRDITQSGFRNRNERLTALDKKARLETVPVKVDYRKSVESIVFKVNDYHTGCFKNFKIKAYGCGTKDGAYTELAASENSNMLTITSELVPVYIKFSVEATAGKEISTLEVFAEYKETDESPLRITEMISGSCITKVYDVSALGKYRLCEVKADESGGESISYSIRGLRVGDDNVYTDWYRLEEEHVFDGYRYFQFKIDIGDKDASTRIRQFILEVIS